MANPEHMEIFNRGIEAWNEWRRDNFHIVPDLSGLDFSRADLSFVDFRKADLRGTSFHFAEVRSAKLSGANLKGAHLRAADFTGTKFYEVDLEEADLRGAILNRTTVWDANLTKANLKMAYLNDATFLNSNLQEADFTLAELKNAGLSETNLTSAVFDGADMSGCKMFEALLIGTSFVNANLSDANLSDAELQRTNLRSANLSGAQLKGIKYDKLKSCRGINVLNCSGSPWFVRHVMDLDYIEETKERYPWGYRFWKLTSDCGRSWIQWGVVSLCLAMLFGGAYDLARRIPGIPDVLAPQMAYSTPHLADSWFTPYYFSIVTFTTLGFGDITPTNTAGQIWLTVEVIFGYIMLGGLITLFATKMVRQSG